MGQVDEAREMYEVSLANLASEKEALRERFDEAVRDAAVSGETYANELIAMSERVSAQKQRADAFAADLALARDALRVAETKTADADADAAGLDAAVADLEARAERERAARAVAEANVARLEEALRVSEEERKASEAERGRGKQREMGGEKGRRRREKLPHLQP